MPVLNIANKSGPPSRDLKVLVRDIADQLHGMPADNKGGTPDEPLREGRIFVDSVGADCMSMTWAFRKGANTWGAAATMDITVGRSVTSKFVATLSMKRVDNSVRDYVSSGTSETAGAAVSNVLSQVLESPWDTLVGHLWVDDSAEAAAGVAYRKGKKSTLWAANIAMAVYFFYIVHDYGASRGPAGAPAVNVGDVMILAGICAAALVVITWLRSRVIAAAHTGVRQALLKWAHKGRTP